MTHLDSTGFSVFAEAVSRARVLVYSVMTSIRGVGFSFMKIRVVTQACKLG